MARKPRIHYTGAVYHVMLRGNAGQPIFYDSKDYSIFEQLVTEGIKRFNHQIHGYCWMPNHIHLVVEVADVPLSKIIQNLSFRYTRWINQRKKRAGHLFQGRYKAILIDTDNYLIELIRYIHLNPVRSGLVTSPADYSRSGHQAYLGSVKCDWLSTDWVLRRFGRKKKQARKDYQRFVSKGLNEGYRKEFHSGNKGGVLGDDEFVINLPEFGTAKCWPARAPLELSEISQQVCRLFEVSEDFLKAKNRSLLASKLRSFVTLLFTEQSGSISQVAEYFGKDLSTLSRQLTNLRRNVQTNATLKQELERAKNMLNARTQA